MLGTRSWSGLTDIHIQTGELAIRKAVVGKDKPRHFPAILFLLINLLLGFSIDLSSICLIQLALNAAPFFVRRFIGGRRRC